MRYIPSLCLLFLMAGCVLTSASDNQIIRPAEYSGVVSIRTAYGAGSGFVVAEQGGYYYVATAAHVVDNGANSPVSAPQVNGIVGEVVAYGDSDNENDVAIIKVKRYSRRYRVYRLAMVRQEDRARGVGFMYENGMDSPEFVVYTGWIVTTNWKGFIAYNGGVFPGCSGGPLLDSWGRAVGVCSRAPIAWGLPFESATLFAPVSAVQTLLDGLDL